LKTQILPHIVPKIPAHPDTIKKLFTLEVESIINSFRNDIFSRVKDDPKVKPLYEAYKKIMMMLYGRTSEDFFEDLFIRHTLMHMTVLASLAKALNKNGDPMDICSGTLLNVDVALPYLNWWKVIIINPRYKQIRSKLTKILRDIVLRVNLIDWTYAEAEDVFRILYEFLVDPITRRKIGEYYTPLWIVEYMLNEFDLKGKVILDPFCGSGTFLILAFYKKVKEESIDRAYSSLVGFDINPLAVAIARAELILAYFRVKGSSPSLPPRIYHCDTLATWFGGEAIGVPEVMNLFRSARDYLEAILNFNLVDIGNAYAVLKALSEIEDGISKALRYAFQVCGLNKERLIKTIDHYLSSFLSDSSQSLTKIFLEHSRKVNLPEKLASLIVKYRGNSIWGSVLISIYAPLVLTRIKPHIIVTNPPWIPTTEFQAPYSSNIRNYLSSIIRARLPEIERRRTTSIINGSDIATAAIGRALTIASEGVAFVMNREQSFYYESPMRAGILTTYAILKEWKEALKLVDINYDAFKHGIYPALIIAKKGRGEKLLLTAIAEHYRSRYSKSLHLTRDLLEIKRFSGTYDDYVKPLIFYFTEDREMLARKLGVKSVIPKGQYIMGIFGGERRKGEQRYAGLFLEKYRYVGKEFEFKLSETRNPLRVPKDWLGQHCINVYNVVYRGEIYPFYVYELLPILLSECGADSLREFLNRALEANMDKLTEDDIESIRALISELRQPSEPKTLSEELYYVVYRCQRAFTAAMIKPGPQTIIESHVAALECQCREQALYYTAVLNYLAYKVIEKGRSFIRDQFAKPALAIMMVGIEWNNVDKTVKEEVMKLCEELSRKICKKEFYDQRAILWHILKNYAEFRRIVELLDSVVDQERLEEALDLVSGRRDL